jgi:dipeptidase
MTHDRKKTGLWTFLIAAVFLLLHQGSPLSACSTIVVGKKASPTGRVLLGHNEDNEGRLVVVRYLVPRQKYPAGRSLAFEDGRARIPEATETASYQWSETIASWNAAFSDSFVNEWGVALVSDSCWPSKEKQGALAEGGIGYGLRRVVAERARSAREGVKIAAELIDRYGYYDSGRTYIIADKDEGWLLEVVMGKHYAARRVADDEVAFIPNHYTIRDIDLKDTPNTIASPGLIEYAVSRGWYKPARPGSTADFDFKQAFMSPESYDTDWKITTDLTKDYNILRHKRALEMLTGRSFGYADKFPFSVKPPKKIGLEEIKTILRSHHEGTPDHMTTSLASSPHSLATICAGETQESLIVEFRNDPRFTVIWRASGRPCTSPYVPWYLGIQELPEGYGWIDPKTGQDNHFKPSAENLGCDPARAWWAFMDLQNALEPGYAESGDAAKVKKDLKTFEQECLRSREAVEAKALASLGKDGARAMAVLTSFTNDRARAAWTLAKNEYDKLDPVKIEIMSADVSKSGRGKTVSVAVLSGPRFDAGQVDAATVRFGPGYIRMDKWAEGTGRLLDANHGGKQDLVLTFPLDDVLKLASPCRSDLWLSGKTRQGRVFAGRGIVVIKD